MATFARIRPYFGHEWGQRRGARIGQTVPKLINFGQICEALEGQSGGGGGDQRVDRGWPEVRSEGLGMSCRSTPRWPEVADEQWPRNIWGSEPMLTKNWDQTSAQIVGIWPNRPKQVGFEPDLADLAEMEQYMAECDRFGPNIVWNRPKLSRIWPNLNIIGHHVASPYKLEPATADSTGIEECSSSLHHALGRARPNSVLIRCISPERLSWGAWGAEGCQFGVRGRRTQHAMVGPPEERRSESPLPKHDIPGDRSPLIDLHRPPATTLRLLVQPHLHAVPILQIPEDLVDRQGHNLLKLLVADRHGCNESPAGQRSYADISGSPRARPWAAWATTSCGAAVATMPERRHLAVGIRLRPMRQHRLFWCKDASTLPCKSARAATPPNMRRHDQQSPNAAWPSCVTMCAGWSTQTYGDCRMVASWCRQPLRSRSWKG